MAILAWLRKVQQALHEYAESIRQEEQRKGNRLMEREREPLKVQAVVSLDEKTVAQITAQKTDPTQSSIKKATWAAFYAVAAYAVVTMFMWFQMMHQTSIFQRQLDEARKATEVQVRPWISVENVNVPTNESLIVEEKIIMTTVAVAIKNIGHSPATHVAVRVGLTMAGTGSFEDLVRHTCDEVVGDTNTSFGQTIFQDKSGNSIEHPIQLPRNEVARYWTRPPGGVFSVFGCAAYRSPISNTPYYTGFIYDVLLRQYPEHPATIPGKDVFLQNALAGFITK
jgi:hypothetical protein